MGITILSIYAPSAGGKATLIKNLKNDKKTRSIFGLDGEREIITTGGGFTPPIEELLKNSSSYTNCYILHKWQTNPGDELKEIKDLNKIFPEAEHKIIVLWWPSWEDWWSHFRSKDKDDDRPMEEHIKWWDEKIIPELNETELPVEHYKICPKTGGLTEYSKLEKRPY